MANKQITYEFANLSLKPEDNFGKLNDYVCIVDEATRQEEFKIPSEMDVYDKAYLSSPRIVRGTVISPETGLVVTPAFDSTAKFYINENGELVYTYDENATGTFPVDPGDLYTSDQVDLLLNQLDNKIDTVDNTNISQNISIGDLRDKVSSIEEVITSQEEGTVGVTVVSKDSGGEV